MARIASYKRGMLYGDKSVLEMARERISRTFDLFDHVVVAFSGGKDSTVCLNLTIDEAVKRGRLPLHVVFWDEEAIHTPTIEYMTRVSLDPRIKLDWFCVPVAHRNACTRKSPYWFSWAPEDKAVWCRPLPPQAITEFPYPGFNSKCKGTVCGAVKALNGEWRHPIPETSSFIFDGSAHRSIGVIMGIRTQESLRRFNVCTRRSYDNYILGNQWCPYVRNVFPIYDWQTEDVWTAPQKFGWDYNTTYDVFTAAGIPRHAQRVCPPYGEEPLNGLHQYAVCFPELWDKMIARVPGAATAGRYARSPLYANGSQLDKPEGMSWQGMIKKEVNKWPDEYKPKIAARIKDEIGKHNQSCVEPIPEDDPHPMTGVSWRFLYMLAVRGDLKNRKMRRMNPAEYEREGKA